MPTRDGTTTFYLTIDWLSQISLQPIIPVPYSKHECGTQTRRTNQGILRLNHLTLINKNKALLQSTPDH